MFRIFFTIAIVIAILGLAYLLTRFRKFVFIRQLAGNRKWLTWLLALIPILVILLFGRRDMVNTVIVVLHLIVFWLLADLIGWFAGLPAKKKAAAQPSAKSVYWQGILALGVTAAYLSIGWFNAHHVFETDYHLQTEKDLGMDSLRVVQISDSHVGATFDGDGFAKHMKRIQETNPDLLVITGDYVDDDTTLEDMIKCCEALGEFQTKYGIFFIYGNHDKGYFDYRNFTDAQLRRELEKNHVRILEDETVLIDDKFYLIGRKDRSTPGRMTSAQLAEGLDPTKYTIVLDHQPHDFAAQAEEGFDLVLCGHTHGGQMFPIGITGELSGANDKTYGLEVRDKTAFIVNSGISGWAIKFKTATFSEFGVIDINCLSADQQ